MNDGAGIARQDRVQLEQSQQRCEILVRGPSGENRRRSSGSRETVRFEMGVLQSGSQRVSLEAGLNETVRGR